MIDHPIKVLVTVKTYPNPSKKYGETVCVAGINIETRKWIRLYPIPFRDLDDYKKFKKYSVIEVRASKAKDDHRPESFKVDSDSIKVIEIFDTKTDKWAKRKEIVLPTAFSSFCEILSENSQNNISLGMFKPRDIQFHYEKTKIGDQADREDSYAQLDFYNKAKNPIEEIPFRFRYSFKCHNNPDCKGHILPIIDWEIGAAYIQWRHNYPTEEVLMQKIREKWLDGMCSSKHDTYFFVGNWKRFPNNFMILGVFYPPILS